MVRNGEGPSLTVRAFRFRSYGSAVLAARRQRCVGCLVVTLAMFAALVALVPVAASTGGVGALPVIGEVIIPRGVIHDPIVACRVIDGIDCIDRIIARVRERSSGADRSKERGEAASGGAPGNHAARDAALVVLRLLGSVIHDLILRLSGHAGDPRPPSRDPRKSRRPDVQLGRPPTNLPPGSRQPSDHLSV